MSKTHWNLLLGGGTIAEKDMVMKEQGCQMKKWVKTLLRVFEGITVAVVLWLGTVVILASCDGTKIKVPQFLEWVTEYN